MKRSTIAQRFHLPLTAATWVWFIVICAIFGGYAVLFSQKILTSQHSELQYLRHENATLIERNRYLEEQLAESQIQGEDIQVPLTEGAEPSSNQRSFIYTVKKGDTIWEIAAFYNVEARDLMRWNNLGPRSQIFPGDQLVITLEE
jgi:hypothetical protein